MFLLVAVLLVPPLFTFWTVTTGGVQFFQLERRRSAFMLVFFRIFVFFLGVAAVVSQYIGASVDGYFESVSHICRCKYLYLHIYFRFTFVWGFKNIVVTDVED